MMCWPRAEQINSTASSSSTQQLTDALQGSQETANLLVGVYQKLARLQPAESGTQIQLAQSAENAGQADVAIAAYKRFLKLAPDDPNALQAKARIKALEKQQG